MFKSKFSNEQPVKMSRKKEGNIPPVRPSLFCKQVDCRILSYGAENIYIRLFKILKIVTKLWS